MKHNLPSEMKFKTVEQLSTVTAMYNHSTVKSPDFCNRACISNASELVVSLTGRYLENIYLMLPRVMAEESMTKQYCFYL